MRIPSIPSLRYASSRFSRRVIIHGIASIIRNDCYPFISEGLVRYCIIRSRTRGFFGRLIWQYWSGDSRDPSCSRDTDRISREIPGRTDSRYVTTPSPSGIARYLPSSVNSQVFPPNQGKKFGDGHGDLWVTIIRYLMSDRRPAVRRR
jgi:hypothetical protein